MSRIGGDLLPFYFACMVAFSAIFMSPMNTPREFVVDFVAKGESPDSWLMVMVEEGPWQGDIDNHLRRIQVRLYDYLEAAIDGKIADLFPESKGKSMIIRLNAFNLPETEVTEFFESFSKNVLLIPDFQKALKDNPFVKNVSFELIMETIDCS